MALRLAGEEIGIQEVVEHIQYSPQLQDSGDLEAGTKTITATAKQATPDYTTSLTIPTPPAKLTVLRLGLRLQVTIDSFGGSPAATELSYSVEVNGVERLTGSWSATGGQYAVVDLTEGQFNLGSANEIKIYLWVDQGEVAVSLCQVWQAVGTTQAATMWRSIIDVAHTGFVQHSVWASRVGTGSFTTRLGKDYSPSSCLASTSGSSPNLTGHILAMPFKLIIAGATVNTDLCYYSAIGFILRRVE